MNYWDEEPYNLFRAVKSKGIDKIHKAVNLMNDEIAEYEKHEQLLKLTEKNLINTIQANVRYDWVDYFIEDAIKWISMRDNIDKRRKYEEKTSYGCLCSKIQSALDIQNINITQIVQGGYDCHYHSIHFTSDIDEHKCVFILEIPVIRRIQLTEETKRCLGMLSFGFKSSDSCYNMCHHSYDVTDFKSTIKEIIKSEEYKKYYIKEE